MNVTNILILLLISGLYISAGAQHKIPDQMKPLEVLLGEWSGKGSQTNPQRQTTVFRHDEQVTMALDGQLMIFQGKGTATDETQPHFQAYGVMSVDPSDGNVYLHAWTADGRYTRAKVTVGDGSFEWGFEVPGGGTIRYVASFDANSWKETGSYSPDQGTTWYPFLETSLTR